MTMYRHAVSYSPESGKNKKEIPFYDLASTVSGVEYNRKFMAYSNIQLKRSYSENEVLKTQV